MLDDVYVGRVDSALALLDMTPLVTDAFADESSLSEGFATGSSVSSNKSPALLAKPVPLLLNSGDTVAGNTSTTVTAFDTARNRRRTFFEEHINSATDEDWFRVEIREETTIRFSLTFADADHTLVLYDATGTALFTLNDASEDNAFFSYEFDTLGTYFIAVEGAGGPYPNSYFINVERTERFAGDDFGANIAEAGVVTNGRVSGTWTGEEDTDWFRIDLNAGDEVELVYDRETYSGQFRIYDAQGREAASGGSSGAYREADLYSTSLIVSDAGTYYVALTGYESLATRYDFGLRILNDDIANDETTTAGIVWTGSTGTLSGVIEIWHDEDWFALDATAGQRLLFEFTNGDWEFLNVQILNADGDVVENGFDPRLFVYEFEFSERYYIKIDTRSQPIPDVTAYDFTVTELPSRVLDAPVVGSLPTRPTTPTVTDTIFHSDGRDFVVASGDILYGFNVAPIPAPAALWNDPLVFIGAPYSIDPDGSLTNHGTIWNYRDSGTTTGVRATNLINTGLIVAEAGAGSARGVTWTPDLQGSWDNSGDIYVISHAGTAQGITTSSTRAVLTNSGSINVSSSSGSVPTAPFSATGIFSSNDLRFVNQAGGELLVQGALAVGVQIGRGSFPDAIDSIENHGLIEVVSTSPNYLSIGLAVSNIANVETMSILNSGTLRADIAIQAANGFFSSTQLSTQTVRNTTTGVIEGDIDLGLGDDELFNEGSIAGNVFLGAGADLFDGRGGLFDGIADLGSGDDIFHGSATADHVRGGFGSDDLDGGAGQDLILGEQGDDVIDGGAGNDGLFGGGGRDEITTQGADIASGGSGDDRIVTTDLAFASIDGGDHFDVWVLPDVTRVLNLTDVLASGRVENIEQIEMQGDQTLVLTRASVSQLSPDYVFRVSGTATDDVYLQGQWVADGQVTIEGADYARYTNNGVSVIVSTDVAVATGFAPPQGTGLDAVASGPAALMPDDVAGMEEAGAIREVRLFPYMDETIVAEGEIWRNTEGSYALTVGTVESVLVNRGTILSVNDDGRLGIFGFAGGVSAISDPFTNQPVVETTIENFGLIRAEATGVGSAVTTFQGTTRSFLQNRAGGVIEAVTEFGTAVGVHTFGARLGTSEEETSLLNQGIIRAFSSDGYAVGIRDDNGGTGYNYGTIYALGGDGAVALDASNSGLGGFTNYGTVEAQVGKNSNFFSVGIATNLSSRISNEGTITADIAVLTVLSSSGYLNLNNSGSINGAIVLDGGDGGDDLVAANFSTLRFENSGAMNGNIIWDLSRVSNTVENSGTINGDVYLGSGNDEYDGQQGQLNGILFLGNGNNTALGGAGDDYFVGGTGIDDMIGNGGNDSLFGGAGNDLIRGRDGADQLFGEAGNDYMHGGNGEDWLSGGAGNDNLFGGLGADVFVFIGDHGEDRISDFDVTSDTILLPGSPYGGVLDLDSMAQQMDGYVLISTGNGNSIRLEGIDLSDLRGDHFATGAGHPDGLGPFTRPSDIILSPKGGSQQSSAKPDAYEAPSASEMDGPVEVAFFDAELFL